MKSISDEEKRIGCKVTDPQIISEIEQYVLAKHDGVAKLILYRSKQDYEKDTLHFVIDSSKKIDISDLPAIGVYIQGKIDFLDVSVQGNEPWAQKIVQRDSIDSVEYTVSNRKKIEQFIDKNFPHFLSYQKQLKTHGCTFSDSEKMEMDGAEMLGKELIETCRQAIESRMLIEEDDVASLITKILQLTAKHRFDSNEIIEKIDTTKIEPPANK